MHISQSNFHSICVKCLWTFFSFSKNIFSSPEKNKTKINQIYLKRGILSDEKAKNWVYFWKQGLSLWNTAASKLRGGGACSRWSYLIWSTKPVQCWWHSLLGATQQTGNLRDMGGRLIRWWRGERTDTQSDWFTVWISASADVQSWTPEF